MMALPNKTNEVISAAFSVNGFPLLEFDRKPIDRDVIRGFALTWNAELTLIQIVNCDIFRLDGYAVFRNADVRWWRGIPKESFLARAVRLHKLRPSKPDRVTIASMRELVASSGAVYPLITIHRERIDRGACYVGKALRTSQRSIQISYITPAARWDGKETYLLRDITLVGFGGVYEGLLAQLASK